jgi:hypothetical protein
MLATFLHLSSDFLELVSLPYLLLLYLPDLPTGMPSVPDKVSDILFSTGFIDSLCSMGLDTDRSDRTVTRTQLDMV